MFYKWKPAAKRILRKSKTLRPLVGEFEVETFTLNGEVVPPGKLDTRRWRKIIVKAKNVDIQYMDGGSGPWHFNREATGSKIILHSLDLWSTGIFSDHRKRTDSYVGRKPQSGLLKINLRKIGENQFLLVNRGFHWVNEYPFNR